ncbi:MAG: O-antigen ligase family protein [Armatimonadota bacterium]|nr:O-antigen ligase family protein [Armatimonadota bacterium]
MIWLAGIAVPLFAREFPGPDGPVSGVYGFVPGAGGVRWIDAGIILAAYVVATASLITRADRWTVSVGMRRALALFALAIVMSAVYGLRNGGTQIFYEWRAIALGVCVAYLTHRIVRPVDVVTATRCLLLLLGARAAVFLLLWLVGTLRVPPFGAPVWDGPTLSSAVAAVALGSGLLMSGSARSRFLVFVLVSVSAGLVLLALRRTYWAELAVSAGILLLAGRRKRGQQVAIVVILGLVLTLVFVPGDVLWPRVMSLVHPTDTTNPLADTNRFHIDQVLDAWDAVRRSPIFGVGQGLPFETSRLGPTHPESWGVHNAPLHVWVRFGLLGLVTYLWFHGSGFRWLLSAATRSPSSQMALAVAAYWIGTFVPSLAFSPWPYGAVQNTALIGALLALTDRWLQLDAPVSGMAMATAKLSP